ncbi:hypothetical protein Taro_039918 [Colocasia esculenta]|uniref:Uncharacterized protein n=1 Tax=Colocasia esculenta TaxID=4460 RepID=A0A843WK94_COLES|nr:hypothetical protein [Colocasia esculenta]
MWEIFHKLRMDYGTYSVVAAHLRWILIFSETSDTTLDVTTFHDLRLDYGTYPAVAAPEISNVVNVPQKEAGLRYLSRSNCLEEVNFDLYLWRPQVWETFHN